MIMADDNLERKLEMVESDLALTEYKPHFLLVSSKTIKDGFYSYFKGFLPNDLQQEGTSKTKNNVINFLLNPLLTAGVSYGLLYNNHYAIPIAISLGIFELAVDLLARMFYTDMISTNQNIPAFFLSEYLFYLRKYLPAKYQQLKEGLIYEEELKSIAEKKVGTLSLPLPGEQGQLSLEDKTGTVSVSKMNEDYFDSSLF